VLVNPCQQDTTQKCFPAGAITAPSPNHSFPLSCVFLPLLDLADFCGSSPSARVLPQDTAPELTRISPGQQQAVPRCQKLPPAPARTAPCTGWGGLMGTLSGSRSGAMGAPASRWSASHRQPPPSPHSSTRTPSHHRHPAAAYRSPAAASPPAPGLSLTFFAISSASLCSLPFSRHGRAAPLQPQPRRKPQGCYSAALRRIPPHGRRGPRDQGCILRGKMWDLPTKALPAPSRSCATNWSFSTGAHISWSISTQPWVGWGGPGWDGASPPALSRAALTFQVAVFLRK